MSDDEPCSICDIRDSAILCHDCEAALCRECYLVDGCSVRRCQDCHDVAEIENGSR